MTRFAYVDFETPEAKLIEITLSEGHLDGRKLLIKDGKSIPSPLPASLCKATFNVRTGDDFTRRPAKAKIEPSGGEGEKLVKNATMAEGRNLSKTAQKILRAQKQPPAQTLFLGNLGFETTEGSVRELFEAHRY
jgi:RNA recognition motif-containing protein